jgi:hypothetical protein
VDHALRVDHAKVCSTPDRGCRRGGDGYEVQLEVVMEVEVEVVIEVEVDAP